MVAAAAVELEKSGLVEFRPLEELGPVDGRGEDLLRAVRVNVHIGSTVKG